MAQNIKEILKIVKKKFIFYISLKILQNIQGFI